MAHSGDYIAIDTFATEALRARVFGGKDPAPIDELTALSLLVEKVYADKGSDLRRLIFDEGRDPRLRYSAAFGGMRDGVTDAETLLKEVLSIAHPLVLRGVLNALGQIGKPDVLDQLERIAAGLKGPALRNARLAGTLITYRFDGGEVFRLPFPEKLSPPPDSASDLTIGPAGEALLADLKARLRLGPLGNDVDLGAALVLTCQGQELVLLTHAALANDPELLVKRKLLAGVVLVRTTVEGEEWVAQRYVLTHPTTDGSGDVFVLSVRGDIEHAGRFERTTDGVRFHLQSASEAPVRHLELVGRLTGQEIVLESGRVSRQSNQIRGNRPLADDGPSL